LTAKTSGEFEKMKAQLVAAEASIKTLRADVAKPEKKDNAGAGGNGAQGKKRPRAAGAGTGFKGNPWRECTICKKKHAGDPPESKCFQRDLEGEKEALDKLIKQKSEMGWKKSGKKDKEGSDKGWKARVAFIEDVNKLLEEYSISLADWSPKLALHSKEYVNVSLNVRQGACVDSGSPVDITFAKDEVNLTCGEKVYLQGILDQMITADKADVNFPTVSKDNKPYVIRTLGKGIFCKTATSKILSLSLLLQANYLVHFEAGLDCDPQYGGTITSPDGVVIDMVFANGTW
jgi:hypothetical protein